jgi:tetratricopeptide (TPR) repeat protein
MLQLVAILSFLAISIRVSLGEQVRVKEGTPQCGSFSSEPIAPPSDGKDRRCDAVRERKYKPRHKGIGFEILDSESQACFVPDQEYRLLDEIIDAVASRVDHPSGSNTQMSEAKNISQTTSDVMTSRGFAIFIDTETLSDALLDRNAAGEAERHIFDCDTGSLILLTVAENLGRSAALVEIPLSHSDFHHNYVQWLSHDGEEPLGWDMNMKLVCITPSGLTGRDGKGMSRDETIGYALSLRAKLWERQAQYERAISDYRAAFKLYGGSSAYNNFAWLVATRQVPGRKDLQAEALSSAQKAISMWPSANYEDTLACVFALQQNFAKASDVELQAIDDTPKATYKHRLEMFEKEHRDCTGE